MCWHGSNWEEWEPRVGSVLLVSKSEDCELLVGYCVEECANNARAETSLLVFVELDDAKPVTGDFRQCERFGQIDKRKHVLLEATASEPCLGTEIKERAHSRRIEQIHICSFYYSKYMFSWCSHRNKNWKLYATGNKFSPKFRFKYRY